MSRWECGRAATTSYREGDGDKVASNDGGDAAARRTGVRTAPMRPAPTQLEIRVDVSAASPKRETLLSSAHATDLPTSAVVATTVFATLAHTFGGAPANRRASRSLSTPPLSPARPVNENTYRAAGAAQSAAVRIAGGSQRIWVVARAHQCIIA